MKKKISFSAQGQRADIGNLIIYRMLPNRYADSVGPFVFLDHIAPAKHSANKPLSNMGTGMHPHRGIATLTYILNGEAEHYDSRQHHATVYSGGVQWMKAGNGILHDETLNIDSKTNDMLTHGFQFWINLPSKIKAETPEYLAIQAAEVPKQVLSDKKSWVKVIVGKYEDAKSKIPSYSNQFLYHIHLEAKGHFSIAAENGIEYAAFLPLQGAIINDAEFNKGDFIEFERKEGTIEIKNDFKDAIDIILFGGETYIEPIVAQGPFVMNTQDEIAQAYTDFHEGKYGKIEYRK